LAGIFFGVIGALGAMLALAWLMSRARAETLAQGTRLVLGLGAIGLGILLMLRGLGVVGAPMAAAGLGLLTTMRRRASPGGDGAGGSAPPPRRGAMSPAEARDILGLSPDAGPDDIKRAYREMMKRVHPDAGGSNTLAAKVREAYETLTSGRT